MSIEGIALLGLALGVWVVAMWIIYLVHQMVKLGKQMVNEQQRKDEWDWLDR